MENRNTFFKSIPDGKGGFITSEWTFGELVSVNIAAYVCMAAFIGVCLGSVAPIFCLLVYFISIEEQRRAANIFGILCGVIYLIDYHYGLISRLVLNVLFTDSMINAFTYLQCGVILAHIILLFFDRKIFFKFEAENDGQSMTKFVGSVIVMVIGGYMIAHAVIPHVLPPLPLQP